MTRALSETDLSVQPKRKPSHHHQRRLFDEDEEESKTGAVRTTSLGSALFSFSELEEGESGADTRDEGLARVLVEGGGGCGGWDKNDGGNSRFGDSNHGNGNENDFTDVYYRTMIEANPGNPLFLSNYARYLKEVREGFIFFSSNCHFCL